MPVRVVVNLSRAKEIKYVWSPLGLSLLPIVQIFSIRFNFSMRMSKLSLVFSSSLLILGRDETIESELV